jgi:hypothetical protein
LPSSFCRGVPGEPATLLGLILTQKLCQRAAAGLGALHDLFPRWLRVFADGIAARPAVPLRTKAGSDPGFAAGLAC